MIHSLVIPLAVGLVLLLFGMKTMEFALERAAGPRLPELLKRFTGTPLRGMAASSVLTALMQSSTAVTVVTIGLVNAGLMRFSQTIGIILGTNIGTCLTTELIGLSLGKIALPMLLSSTAVWLIAMAFVDRKPKASKVGFTALATAGFACILLGVGMMQGLTPELEARGMFTWLIHKSQESRLWGVLAGAAVTAVIHSSAATIAMTMSLVGSGAFPPELGIAIIFGANVGTCATALLASIGGSRYGAYVAWTHTLLNIGGAALFYPFIPPIADLVTQMSADAAVQMARAQTLFNVLSSLLALPLCYLLPWQNKKKRIGRP
ncbi:Na/Pi cotransporter family protein [Gorillibacterium timonense]|uniref:Na/Pi cotransporter family protein n=1 Tax=Gorillibacterium timonense TaxID=1689269 RepID=UPI00071E3195|nr:Na/Pi symporter [Gorillibacterium timonense]